MRFIESTPIKEIADLTYTMWQMGWDEKNGGNISYLLDEQEISLLDEEIEIRSIPLANIPENMIGKYLLITSSGSNFRLIKDDLIRCLGVLKITESGYDIVWGFAEENHPTSELYMHLLSHSQRLKVDSNQRVVVHNHATDILAMTFMHDLDEKNLLALYGGLLQSVLLYFLMGLVSYLGWFVEMKKLA